MIVFPFYKKVKFPFQYSPKCSALMLTGTFPVTRSNTPVTMAAFPLRVTHSLEPIGSILYAKLNKLYSY